MAKRYVVCVSAGWLSPVRYYKQGGTGWTTDIKRATKFDSISAANVQANRIRQGAKSDAYSEFLPTLKVTVDPYIG